MVEIVEELVKRCPILEPRLFRDELVVAAVELLGEAAKHPRDGQVELVVTVEGGGIEDDGFRVRLTGIPTPKIPVKKRRKDGDPLEEFPNLRFQLGPKFCQFRAPGLLFLGV